MHYAYVGQGIKWDMHLLHLFCQFPGAAGGERARLVPPKCSSLGRESDCHIIPWQLKALTQSESRLWCGVIEIMLRLCWVWASNSHTVFHGIHGFRESSQSSWDVFTIVGL
jgi:hypothetical protein